MPAIHPLRLAIVGATGAVGREMLKVADESDLPIASVRLFASTRSAGEELSFRDRSVEVELLPDEVPGDLDVVLMSAGSAVSRSHAPRFAARAALVIDNSSAWRMDPAVPLVVPEVNPEAIRLATRPGGRRIVANPNCSTIQLVVVLKPLHDAFTLQKVVVSTYQSVSGAGQKGLEELSQQCVALFNHREIVPKAFPHQIAFNMIPAIGAFRDDGYTEEEWKLVVETKKILGLPDLRVSPTAVRVPVFSCHGEAAHLEFRGKVTPKEVRACLARAEGVILLDRPEENVYPMPFPLAGSDAVHVGRIRQDPTEDRCVNLWIVADNLRKGAALNALQILSAHLELEEEDEA